MLHHLKISLSYADQKLVILTDLLPHIKLYSYKNVQLIHLPLQSSNSDYSYEQSFAYDETRILPYRW